MALMIDFLKEFFEAFRYWYRMISEVVLTLILSVYLLGCLAADRALGPRRFDAFLHHVLRFRAMEPHGSKAGKEPIYGSQKADHR
jgi:hypothetical protein